MENVVHRGNMHCLVLGILQKKQWAERFYVLYGSTRGNQSRLDFYESEESFEHEPKYRKSIFMEDIRDIQPRFDIVKGRGHILDIHLDHNKKDIKLSCDSQEERDLWVKVLREVKQGYHRLSLPSIGASPTRPDSTIFDDNDLYEETELSTFFSVEIAQTETARQCHLVGEYVLVVKARHLELRADSGDVLYHWPYMFIRRYGRSSSSFTFEAGRKCASGAGLFTFLTSDGDKVFQTVLKHTRPLRGPGNSVASIEEEPPPVPKRDASHGGTDSDLLDLPVFDDKCASPNHSPDTLPPAPPLLKPLKPKPKLPLNPQEEYAQVNKPTRLPVGAPVATKHSSVQYDLAKVRPNLQARVGDPENVYSEPYEPTTLDVTYKVTGVSPEAADEPDYAIYDITRSSRYNPTADDLYEIPEAPSSTKTNLSEICATLRQQSLEEESGPDTYDTLELGNHAQQRNRQGNEYSDIDGDTLSDRRIKRKLLPEESNVYDEVAI